MPVARLLLLLLLLLSARSSHAKGLLLHVQQSYLGFSELRGCSDFMFVPGSNDCHIFIMRVIRALVRLQLLACLDEKEHVVRLLRCRCCCCCWLSLVGSGSRAHELRPWCGLGQTEETLDNVITTYASVIDLEAKVLMAETIIARARKFEGSCWLGHPRPHPPAPCHLLHPASTLARGLLRQRIELVRCGLTRRSVGVGVVLGAVGWRVAQMASSTSTGKRCPRARAIVWCHELKRCRAMRCST